MKILAAFFLVPTFAFAMKAGFIVKATGGITVRGECSEATRSGDAVQPKRSVYSVKLASCKTGNGGRDEHVQLDLDVKQFPSADLRVESDGATEGVLFIRGVSKPVALTWDGNKVTAKIKLSDFNVPRRTFLMMSVRDEAEVWGEL